MSDDKTHFGYQQVGIGEKAARVADVFRSVAPKYDLMNDLMSFGIHRIWKRFTLELAGVRPGHKVLDLAGGTGDLAIKFSRIVGDNGKVVLADINDAMLEVGRDRLMDAGCAHNTEVAQVNAEALPFADGSDMMGSLRNPAGWANIFGFRPTWGRVPNVDSTDLYAHQLSTNGPMGRSVADMELLLDDLAGWDDRAPLGIAETPAFLAGLEGAEGSAKGLRIGWMGDWNGRWPMEPGILETCGRALKVFEDLGAEVVPLVPDHDFEAIWEGWTTLRSWMMAGKYAADHADPERRARLKPEVIWEVERGLAMSALEVHRAVEKRADWHRTLERVFGGVDLLAAPSAQTWPFPVDWRYPEEIAGRAMDTYHRWMEVMLPASFSGRPAVSVPAGFSGPEARAEGLPIGLQLIGRVRADREVLRAAAAFEAAADWARRTPPEPGAG